MIWVYIENPRSMVLNWGWFCSLRSLSQCLETFLIAKTGNRGYYWWLLVGSQGCYYTSYNIQNSLPTTKHCRDSNVNSIKVENTWSRCCLKKKSLLPTSSLKTTVHIDPKKGLLLIKMLMHKNKFIYLTNILYQLYINFLFRGENDFIKIMYLNILKSIQSLLVSKHKLILPILICSQCF